MVALYLHMNEATWGKRARAYFFLGGVILILILIKIPLTKVSRRPFMQNPGATLPAF